jgi:hypothetical protein
MAFRIQLRRDTATRWQVSNPVLLSGEIGYETNTKLLKIGDGTTLWNDLEYWEGNLTIDVNGTEVVQGVGSLNFTGGVVASATGGNVNLDFSNIGGSTGPTGPAADIGVFDDLTFVPGVTGIRFSGGGVSVSSSGDVAIVTVSSLANSLYNESVRYLIDSDTVQAAGGPVIGSNEKITIHSSGNAYFNRSWIRSGTILTVSSASHGLSAGDGVLVRNYDSADSYGYYIVQTVTTNTFTLTVANSGNNSGTGLAYIPAFSVTTWGSGNNATISSPSSGNAQLLSVTMCTIPDGSIFYVTVDGAGQSNGAGVNNSVRTMDPPFVKVNLTDGGLNNSSARCDLDINSPYNTFEIAGLQEAEEQIIKLLF